MKKVFDSRNWLNIILAAGFIIALMCGIAGWFQYYAAEGKQISFWTSVYLSLQLLNLGGYPGDILRVPVLLDIARFLMPAVLATTILNVFIIFFRKQLNEIRISYFFRDHYIFCGNTDLTKQLIHDLDRTNRAKEGKIRIVIIDEKTEPEELHDISYTSNVRLIKGKINEESTLKKSNLHHAKHILALDINDHVNLAIAKNVKSLLSSEPSGNEQVKMTIKLEDFYNLRMFKDFQVVENAEDKIKKTGIDFHAFDPEQIIASNIIDSILRREGSPMNDVIIDENAPAAHIMIMGLGSLGQKLLVEAAQMYHFPNLKKLRVTLVDHSVREKAQALTLRQPFLSEIIDIDLVEIEELAQLKTDLDVSGIVVCFVTSPGDSECLQRSIQLRQFLFDKLKSESIPGIVTLLTSENLRQDLLGAASNQDFLTKFNIQHINTSTYLNKETIIDDKEKVDEIANKIHESWLNQVDKKKFNKNKGWEKLSDSDKDSNRYPARHFQYVKLPYLKKHNCILLYDTAKKLTAIGTNIGKMEHNRWNAEKLLTGFVKGDNNIPNKTDKDLRNRLKYHYCICPWESLDPDNQMKDIDPTQYLLKCNK